MADISDDEFSAGSDEEDEIQELLSTLQRVYNEVCSPPRTRPSTPGEDLKGTEGDSDRTGSRTTVIEGWVESDDEEEEVGVESEGDGEKELEVFNKLEETRSTLEEMIGMEKLMEAYTIIQVNGWVELICYINHGYQTKEYM